MPAAHVTHRPIRSRLKRPIATALLSVAALTVVAGSLLACVTPAPPAVFDDDEARKAILDVRAKVIEQQRQLDAMSRKVDDLTARAEPMSRAQIDTQNQLESMRQEIARLRGQLEVQANELANAQKRERDLF